MMFLTVILNTLAATTAIRVPPVWPEQDLKVASNTYNPDPVYANSRNPEVLYPGLQQIDRGFYTPELEQQAYAAYASRLAQNQRRPSGSHAESSDGKTKPLKENSADVRNSAPNSHKRAPAVLHVNMATKNNRDHYNHNVQYNRPPITKTRHNNPKTPAFSQPVVYSSQDFPASADGWMPIAGQHSPHKLPQQNNVYSRRNIDGNPNQIPNKSSNRRHSPPINPSIQRKNYEDRQEQSSDLRQRVLSKNYRDDKTHEPSNQDDLAEIQDDDSDEEIVSADLYEPQKEVPTRPIYPGEGRWATPGLKHRPFVSNHQFSTLKDDTSVKPEGYETFERAAPAFEKQHSRFNANLQSFPQKHDLGEFSPEKDTENETEASEEQKEDIEEEHEADESDDDGFVPTRLLAQVRKTENEEHLPRDPEDGRLREVIKDSKIHTVYTEEGYEDVEYDHAGHEKNAEEGEGHAEYDKEALKQRRKYPKSKNIGFDEVDVLKEFEKYEDVENNNRKGKSRESVDYETSASTYENPNEKDNMKINKFAAASNENKTTEVKNMDGGDTELEITSEIKIMTQPNNVKTAHKFVKIVPKSKSKDNIKRSVVLKRRKRFVNDFPKIDVHKDYLDVLNPEKIRAPPAITTEKYPYYRIRNTNVLNKNSPLRYAENMKNIPHKIPGRMSFYEQSGASECPEIPRNINPIPDRIQNIENKVKQGESAEGSGGMAEMPDVPRLKNLGDKIDCLKAKFFGKNPLDSPIFQEKVIGPPDPIFQEFMTHHNPEKLEDSEVLAEYDPYQSDYNEEVQEDLPEENSRNHQYVNDDYEQSEEPYSTIDIKEDYSENNADYATLDQEIYPQTTIKTPIIPTPTVLRKSALPTLPERPNISTVSDENVEETKKSTNYNHHSVPVRATAKVNFMPKHIYDKIEMAEDADRKNSIASKKEVKISKSEELHTPKVELQRRFDETTANPISTTEYPNNFVIDVPLEVNDDITTTTNQNASDPSVNEVDSKTLFEINGLMQNLYYTTENSSDRQPKAFSLSMQPINKYNISAIDITTSRSEPLPENAALRVLRKRRKRPHPMPVMNVFDINRFLPTPLPPIITFPITSSTVLPKYKTLSEVYYKDEIQPNEQLNVFADVINNIKNSPNEPLLGESSEHVTMTPNIWKKPSPQSNNGRKVKVPIRKIRIKNVNTNYRPPTTTTTTTSTTIRPQTRRKTKYKNHKSNAQIYEEYLSTIKENNAANHNLNSHHKEAKKVPQSTFSIYTPQKYNPSSANTFDDIYVSEDASFSKPIIADDLTTGTVVDEVLGLAPPYSLEFPSRYQTVANQNPSLVASLLEPTQLNTFIVPGMKPPGTQKPLLYSDFKLLQHNRVRRRNNNYHRIKKRSPFKPSYSEIKRGRPEPVTEEPKEEEEEDDYVPQRNRNFRYDVEKGKVIYTKKQEVTEEPPPEPEEEVEEEEEEEEGEYLTLVKATPPKPFVVITTERNGPSFLDYVHQLRNNTDYKFILEPTKKPPQEATTKPDSKEAESTTTKQVVQANVPDFLNVVAQLRSNENYKEIRDKKEKKTTTAAPEEEEEEEELEEELEEEIIQNSPGGSSNGGYDRTQIFDITEYLPRPKTVIDYSKYKTIERAPVARRHNYSSRYSSDDENLPLNNRESTKLSISDGNEDNIEGSSSEKRFENSESGTRRSGYSSSIEEEDEEEEEELVTSSTTTQAPRIVIPQTINPRIRGRKRPTTTTPEPTISVSTTRSPSRRRRPTTTPDPVLQENSATQRVIRRKIPTTERHPRQSQKVPPNHKAFYSPIAIEEDGDSDSRRPLIHRKRKVSRLVTPDQLPGNSNSSSSGDLGKAGEIQPRKLTDVQVFKKYDQNKRHGGNYRREEEIANAQAVESNSVPPTAYEIEDSQEISRLTDVVPKPFAFYSDPTLPKSVNQLTEPKAATHVPVAEAEETGVTPSVQDKNDKDYREDYVDEVRINFDNSETATNKSVYIVKDPSKRLYFYAPVK